MPGPRRTQNTVGHAKLAELVASLGSLLAVARRARVDYGRLLRIVDGVEPRAGDALALTRLGIDVSDWSAGSTPDGFEPERSAANPEGAERVATARARLHGNAK